jgi:hypothetical protein
MVAGRWLFLVVALGGCWLTGCQGPPADSTAPQSAGPAVTNGAPPEETAPEMIREKATVGVGKRGGEVPDQPTAVDIVTTPTNIYFAAQEQVVFNIQIPQALDLYKAMEGHPPQSEQEFFDNIIKANNIKLPELPAGHRYVFDPRQQQLLVEHPK